MFDDDVEPPAPAPGALRLFTSGGLGEIGRNMTGFQFGDEVLVVDCGVLFPSQDTPGVDLILPDIYQLRRAALTPKWLVLTHAHEDHIGASSYLLRDWPDIEVFGTPFTLAVARGRWSEHGLNVNATPVMDGQTIKLGPYTLTFIPVSHSVPSGVGLLIQVGDLRVLHSGDFNLNEHTLDERKTDLEALEKAGDVGIDLLLSDSTNACVPSNGLDEMEIFPHLMEAFAETRGRVVLACFASNIHRVQQAVQCAEATNRKVCFLGRTMIRNMGIAQQMGMLRIAEGVEIASREIGQHENRDVAIICTGSQGEPLSALSRIARGEHQVRVGSGDRVIMSARLIPGNEEDIFRVINGLEKMGASVLYPDNARIHASGHAAQPQLKTMLELVRPKHFMPIHGEWRHLRCHASLANEAGVHPDRILLLRNGDVLDLVEGVALILGSWRCEPIYVDGTTVGHVGRTVLRDRVQMAEGGLLHIVIALNGMGELATSPVIDARGVPDSGSLRAEVRTVVEGVLGSASDISDFTRRGVRRIERDVSKWLYAEYRLKPLVIVAVVTT